MGSNLLQWVPKCVGMGYIVLQWARVRVRVRVRARARARARVRELG